MKNLFCFGYGYSCYYLTDLLRQEEGQDWTFSGTTRDEEKMRALREQGVNSCLFDMFTPLPDPLYMMKDVTHLLISTPPTDDGDPTFNIHAHDIARLQRLEWVGYLSTTGPYGDRGGAWVDETSASRPTTKRGSRRLKAEEQWLSLFEAQGLPVHIFRLAGIYGPGRSALDSVRHGVARRIEKKGHAFSRIHVEDLAHVIQASMMAPKPGEVYNVCDDHPAPSHEVIDYACQMLGIESPPLLAYEDVDMAPITRSFYADNKRVQNNKIKNDLGITLQYPDYKQGLQGCFDSERGEKRNLTHKII